ncbi:phosphonate ABC transporter, permease protein PhnE [Desulfovibrio subterraneus]|jgi:phosphonate transport system permease protein|uniref:Phosphonate ABC transporter, permease protein PhnE n=1 Tax=Desulfovibrio subterraneus TaxID=2718620 RepID=A0A7J0BJF9_9BACT|nr:phosphonate ABC transporter, permease protein PhnE [Desulfovibrio subterraneus]WBF67854.1 phosphonate ABC transporter, permease protein PhnE [Desulfovibrio subterraneus]GFM33698.1 phosphonate ABC transporter, permease protein PhnE [Desulfovibrio subterraneus]
MTDNATWERFTPAQRLARFAVYLGAVSLFVVSLKTVEIIPEFLYDAPTQLHDLFSRMWPVDFAAYNSEGIHKALVETLNIASLGTILAIFMAIPVGLMAAKNITKIPALNWFGTLILVSSRTVNSLVWAILFVAIFGPGALAGTIAIAFRSIGFCGKLMAEALEEVNEGPIEALKAAGAPWPSILIKGYWPQVAPAFWGISLFRWDINVRESSVIGLVGAGGIGVALDTSLNLFRWQQVSLILLCIFTVVIVAEVFVTKIRQKII